MLESPSQLLNCHGAIEPQGLTLQHLIAWQIACHVGTLRTVKTTRRRSGGSQSVALPTCSIAKDPSDCGVFRGLFKQAEIFTSVVLCDMNVPGLPLTYVNKAFETMTGFSKGEAKATTAAFRAAPSQIR